ncbi:unnamed protein product [Lymnaea stagnalis]|uniref:G-protein coupled receptors family 1 profile domain-containing protein n=1 Tax=Lymnaea stagnalis TaxID=6523 RepID=A0AAV2IAR0_LYMST
MKMMDQTNQSLTVIGSGGGNITDAANVVNPSFVNTLVTQSDFSAWMGMYSCVDIILSTVGIITNVVNIKTFLAMGADDGVTVSFLFLSASELLCCLDALGQKLSMALWTTEMASGYRIWFYVQPYAFNIFFGNIRTCLFAMPVLITTYLAVAKCMCVVRPLSFKNVFSVSRTFRVMIGICVFSLLTYVPMFTTMGIVEKFDANVNATRRLIWFAPFRDLVKNITWNARDSFLAIASQIILVICVVVMAKALSDAVVTRDKLKNGTLSEKTDLSHGKLPNDAKTASRLSGKELQVIKQVTLISVIYIVANTPKIIVFLAVAVVPEMAPGGLYQNLYEVIIKGREHFELYISAANVFIYYKYNTKFRQCCKC